MQNSISSYLSSRNSYVAGLLDPANVVSDIPDDIMRMHSKRQETVTYNLTVGDPAAPNLPGSGIIVLWPNNPTYIIGGHYKLISGGYVFDQFLTTAQNLSESYDWGRKAAQKISVKSSTLPAGVYALNGTMNAVRFDGTLSEISTFDYGQLLSITTNHLDKKGNVLVGDGVTVLTLPTGWDIPYMRLGDTSPSATNTPNYIETTDGGLQYVISTPEVPVTVTAPNTPETWYTTTVNFDALESARIQVNTTVHYVGATGGVQAVGATIQLLGISGNVIATKGAANTVDNPEALASPLQDQMVSLEFVFIKSEITEPVVAARILHSMGSDTAGGTFTVSARVIAVSENTAWPGHSNPTVVLAYQGLANGTQLTVAGISNFELIPNPGLQKNLALSYGRYLPRDMEYAKMLLSHREELGIRSVMSTGEYEQLLARMEIYTDYANGAESFDFGSLLRTIKSIAVPALSAIFPAAAPLIGAGSGLIDSVLGTSASGPMYGNSASGPSYGSSMSQPRRVGYQMSSTSGRPRRLMAHSADTPMEGVLETIGTAKHPSVTTPVTLSTNGSGMALFPVILTHDNIPLATNPARLFAAVELTTEVKKQLPLFHELPYYRMGGRTIWNAKPEVEESKTHLPLHADYILLPVYSFSNCLLTTDIYPLTVSGTSHQLAVYAADMGKTHHRVGLPPSALFTGGMSGPSVLPVYGIPMKRALANRLELPLIGNSKGTIRISKLMQLKLMSLPHVGREVRSDMPEERVNVVAQSK